MASEAEVEMYRKAKELEKKEKLRLLQAEMKQCEKRIEKAYSESISEGKDGEEVVTKLVAPKMLKCLILKIPNSGKLMMNGLPLVMAKEQDIVNLPEGYARAFPQHLKVIE